MSNHLNSAMQEQGVVREMNDWNEWNYVGPLLTL